MKAERRNGGGRLGSTTNMLQAMQKVEGGQLVSDPTGQLTGWTKESCTSELELVQKQSGKVLSIFT